METHREGPMKGGGTGWSDAAQSNEGPASGSWETPGPPSLRPSERPALPTAWVCASGLQDSGSGNHPVCGFVTAATGNCPLPCLPWGRREGARPYIRPEHTASITPGLHPLQPPARALRWGGASRSVAGGPFWHSHGPRPPRLPTRSPPGSRPAEAWGGGLCSILDPFTVVLYKTGDRVTSDAGLFVG